LRALTLGILRYKADKEAFIYHYRQGSKMKKLKITLLTILCSCFVMNAQAQTLYDNLGGKDTIHQIMVRTLELSLKDKRIAHTLERSDMNRLARLLTDQTCELTGGPCKYDGLDMKKAHVGLGLTTAHFNALVEHLQQAMSEANISNRTQNKLLSLLAPMHRDVVEK